jgi:hypothetical protein
MLVFALDKSALLRLPLHRKVQQTCLARDFGALSIFSLTKEEKIAVNFVPWLRTELGRAVVFISPTCHLHYSPGFWHVVDLSGKVKRSVLWVDPWQLNQTLA